MNSQVLIIWSKIGWISETDEVFFFFIATLLVKTAIRLKYCQAFLPNRSAGAWTEQTCRNELPQTQVSTRPTVHWVNRTHFFSQCTKQIPSLNYLINHLSELWVVNLKLEKQQQDLSRNMDVNQEITISWKNTLEKPRCKPRYKRTDNFG